MARVTFSAINKAIADAGGNETLVRAHSRDYFYFAGGSSSCWRETSVYVVRLGSLSLSAWLAEWRRLRSTQ